MSLVPTADDERACNSLVASFAYFVDHALYEDLANLFTLDGSFSRPGIFAQGRQNVLESWSLRPATTTILRHICTTPVFTAWSESDATSVTYATIYSTEPGTGPYPVLHPPAALVEYHDTFAREEGHWKIAKREVIGVMVAEA